MLPRLITTIAIVALIGCSPTRPEPPLPPGGIVEQIDNLHDVYRAQHNLKPLTRLPELDRIAQRHSERMARTVMSHAGFSERCNEAEKFVGQGICAENVARNPFGPNATMNSWMSSSGHRRNILNPKLKYIGVGIEGDFYCVLFHGD